MTSKYKNPDKFIKKLKEEIEFLRGVRDNLNLECRKREGDFWFDYSDSSMDSMEITTDVLKKARIDQDVIIIAEIMGYERLTKSRSKVTFNLKGARLMK